MIKIGQITKNFYFGTDFYLNKKIKKIGFQTNYLLAKVKIDGKEFEIGKNNILQFDNLNQVINKIRFIKKKTNIQREDDEGNLLFDEKGNPIYFEVDKNSILVIIDYEEIVEE